VNQFKRIVVDCFVISVLLLVDFAELSTESADCRDGCGSESASPTSSHVEVVVVDAVVLSLI